ncbi:MAG: hypothetical protein WC135_09345 [Bacteroidales bacterium]
MKQTKLILLALFGLFLFNSCKDKDPEPTNPITAVSNSIASLKSMTGISLDQAVAKFTTIGYAQVTSFPVGDEFIVRFFAGSDSTNGYMIYESKGVIFFCGYLGNKDKATSLSNFEKYSQDCNSYMTGKDFIFESELENLEGESLSFTTHQEFITQYLAIKLNLQYASESWLTAIEGVVAEYDYDDEDETIQTFIAYINREYAPADMFEEKAIIKNILKYKKTK